MKFEFTREQLQQMKDSEWLTDRERFVFELYYLRGLHIEDIAAQLDVSRSTIDRVLRNIRNKSK